MNMAIRIAFFNFVNMLYKLIYNYQHLKFNNNIEIPSFYENTISFYTITLSALIQKISLTNNGTKLVSKQGTISTKHCIAIILKES